MIRAKLVIISSIVVLMMIFTGVPISTLMEGYGNQQQKTLSNLSSSSDQTPGWLDTFDLERCKITPRGSNIYFIVEPGYQLVLQGQEDNKTIVMTVTVLNETKIINGTELGIVEEKSIENGELVEISKNYFGVCPETDDVFYFGEDTDWYEGGKIVNHEGTWQAGVGGAKPGMIMPGQVKVGLKYYQELASGLDEGRAEIVNINDTLVTPAGTFKQVLRTEETTPLEPGEKEYKLYAPGVGLIQDNTLKLVRYSSH
jgi:hypothetical protein